MADWTAIPSEMTVGFLAEDERLRCQCDRQAIYELADGDRRMIPCVSQATAEDRLCDQCRGRSCTLLSVVLRDGPREPIRRHVAAD